MIVQCEHCQTRYRIPDEKVKGKGVKVRCAKCNNTFTVQPPPDTKVPTATVPRQPAPPPQQRQPAGDVPEPPQPSDEAALPFQPPPGDLPGMAPGPFEPPATADEGPSSGAHRPAHETDRGTPGPLVGGPGSLQDATDFGIEPTPHPDPFAPQPTPEGSPPGDLAAGSGEGGGDLDWGNISLGEQPGHQADEGIGLAGLSPYEPPQPTRMEEQPAIVPHQSSPEASMETKAAPSYRREEPAPKKSRKGLVWLLLIALLGAGGYYAYPSVMKMVRSRGQQPEGKLTPEDVQVRSITRKDGTVIYTVRGRVRNDSNGSVGMIQLEAQFRNDSGNVLSTSSAYSGNIFNDDELSDLDLRKVQGDLQNELGQSLSNANIRPGQVVPFLMVLENPPSGISKVTVTITGFKETT